MAWGEAQFGASEWATCYNCIMMAFSQGCRKLMLLKAGHGSEKECVCVCVCLKVMDLSSKNFFLCAPATHMWPPVVLGVKVPGGLVEFRNQDSTLNHHWVVSGRGSVEWKQADSCSWGSDRVRLRTYLGLIQTPDV